LIVGNGIEDEQGIEIVLLTAGRFAGHCPNSQRERTRGPCPAVSDPRATVSAPQKSLATTHRPLEKETLSARTHLTADRLGIDCITSGAHFRRGRVLHI
jgi:hypothetical protein